MLAAHQSNHGGNLMFNGQINKTSPQVDIWEVLSGVWNEYDSGEWHIVKCPFFMVITATLDAGPHPLPFPFDVPVAGLLACPDKTVEAVVVRPLETAINLDRAGLVTFHLFGDGVKPKAVR